MDFEDILHDYLAENMTLVNGDIYSGIAPESVKSNYLIHQKISGFKDYAHDGPTGLVTSDYQFDSYAFKKEEAKAIMQELKNLIDGFDGAMNGNRVQGAFLLDESDDHEKDTNLYRITTEYRFQHYE